MKTDCTHSRSQGQLPFRSPVLVPLQRSRYHPHSTAYTGYYTGLQRCSDGNEMERWLQHTDLYIFFHLSMNERYAVFIVDALCAGCVANLMSLR